MSLLTRPHRGSAPEPAEPPADGRSTGEPSTAEPGGTGDGRRSWWRRIASGLLTAVAALVVLTALVAPDQLLSVTPEALVRLPAEGIFGAAVLLVLPSRIRRIVAILGGIGLGLLTIDRIIDAGFYTVLARPFDLVLDWGLFSDGLNFVRDSGGQAAVVGAFAGSILLALAVLALTTFSVVRLTRILVWRTPVSAPAVAVLAIAWISCAALGAQLLPGVPIASRGAASMVHGRALRVQAGFRDAQKFAKEASVDKFADTPGSDLLTALKGKDVMVTFVESYGRSALSDPAMAAEVAPVLDAGTKSLGAAGYQSRSGFLTSPTAGGGSWLAHSTLLSGLWINNQQRYRNLLASNRLTLNRAFTKANWRTVAVMPGTSKAWPEGSFYDEKAVYPAKDLGYRGPAMTLHTMPDQYTLAQFERLEHGKPGHPPLMGEIPLTSSHTPWAPVPTMIPWDKVGDGSVYGPIARNAEQASSVWTSPAKIRKAYAHSVAYTMSALISYVQKYGDDKLVLIVLGDHQPAPIVTGDHASRDVPISIITKDQSVLDHISGWKWQSGLHPSPTAPVWRMNTFRDRFLTAFAK
ncbi:MAG: sulfatase [Actinomycetia bacterium]|nr:sulfatase [Actinomycetes bacterium]